MAKVISFNTREDGVHHFIFDNEKELFLIGTAHISANSVKLVESVITEIQPDTIAVELDKRRLDVLQNQKRYKETDVVEILKSKKVLFFAAQLMLTAYQKKMAKKTGVMPGAEFKKAVEMAAESGAKIVTADRDISITLKRTFNEMTLKEKAGLLGGMLLGSDDEDIDEEKIEELKNADTLTQLIGEMGEALPSVKRVILDERDTYLATQIVNNLGTKTVAVVGAAHVPGIIKHFEEKLEELTVDKLERIEFLPQKTRTKKIIPWVIPLVILALFVYGFFLGDMKATGTAALYWIGINGVLSALGALLALGHPLTIITAFVAAPITSLNPTIGAGMVTGLVQLWIVKPTVSDMEKVGDDASSLKGWYRNRLTRMLLVALLSSVGSAIGTFVAIPFLMKYLT
ncbi:TraB/GumN family protein [bacterium]|nr:TraB/GumN family protein [bacterium]